MVAWKQYLKSFASFFELSIAPTPPTPTQPVNPTPPVTQPLQPVPTPQPTTQPVIPAQPAPTTPSAPTQPANPTPPVTQNQPIPTQTTPQTQSNPNRPTNNNRHTARPVTSQTSVSSSNAFMNEIGNIYHTASKYANWAARKRDEYRNLAISKGQEIMEVIFPFRSTILPDGTIMYENKRTGEKTIGVEIPNIEVTEDKRWFDPMYEKNIEITGYKFVPLNNFESEYSKIENIGNDVFSHNIKAMAVNTAAESLPVWGTFTSATEGDIIGVASSAIPGGKLAKKGGDAIHTFGKANEKLNDFNKIKSQLQRVLELKNKIQINPKEVPDRVKNWKVDNFVKKLEESIQTGKSNNVDYTNISKTFKNFLDGKFKANEFTPSPNPNKFLDGGFKLRSKNYEIYGHGANIHAPAGSLASTTPTARTTKLKTGEKLGTDGKYYLKPADKQQKNLFEKITHFILDNSKYKK